MANELDEMTGPVNGAGRDTIGFVGSTSDGC